jgi:hypothetical protein
MIATWHARCACPAPDATVPDPLPMTHCRSDPSAAAFPAPCRRRVSLVLPRRRLPRRVPARAAPDRHANAVAGAHPHRRAAGHHLRRRRRYLQPALGTLDHFLRDHYNGAVGRMDPRLYDLLHACMQRLRSRGAVRDHLRLPQPAHQ